MKTTLIDYNAAEWEIVSQLQEFIDNEFRALTVNTLDVPEVYWAEFYRGRVKTFTKGSEFEAKVAPMAGQVGRLCKFLVSLNDVAASRVSYLRANEAGWA